MKAVTASNPPQRRCVFPLAFSSTRKSRCPPEPIIVQNGCAFADTEFAALNQEFNGNKASKLKCASLFYKLLYNLENAESVNTSDTFLDNACKYIEEHICGEYMNFAELAELSGLSTEHFRHKFKKLSGLSPLQYCNRLKTARIKELLRTSDIPIAVAAQAMGFADANYFSRFFKKHAGVSPSEYRCTISESN